MKQINDFQSDLPMQPEMSSVNLSRKTPVISNYAQLPVALNAALVAATLGISRAGAYNLMRSEGFPTLYIGKRMVVPKDKLIIWMDKQLSA